MTKRTGPSNCQLKMLIEELEKRSADSGIKIWGRIAKDLSKPSRQRRTVNVYKIEKCAKDGETIVVPGKVLNQGELKKKVDVAAFSFSKTAEEKISKVGKVMSIKELIDKNPQGKKVRILG